MHDRVDARRLLSADGDLGHSRHPFVKRKLQQAVLLPCLVAASEDVHPLMSIVLLIVDGAVVAFLELRKGSMLGDAVQQRTVQFMTFDLELLLLPFQGLQAQDLHVRQVLLFRVDASENDHMATDKAGRVLSSWLDLQVVLYFDGFEGETAQVE